MHKCCKIKNKKNKKNKKRSAMLLKLRQNTNAGASHPTESDIRKVVSPPGALPNACQSVVIRRTYKPLGTMKSWWFTIIGDEEAILQVEQKWNQVRSDDCWILLKSLQDRPRSISPSNTITDSQLANDPVSTAPSSGTNTQAIEPLLLGPNHTHPASSQQSGQHNRPHLATNASKRPLRDQASSPKPFRILWGTQHSTQESDIKLALQAAGAVPDCASVHKTVRKSRSGTGWWFTIIAEEEYISKIDLHWAEISQHPKWALLRSLRDRPRSAMPSDTITNPQLASDQAAAPRHPSSPGATTQAAVPLPSGHNHVHPASSQQSEQDARPHLTTNTSNRPPARDQTSSPRPFCILWGTQHSLQESDVKHALQVAGPMPDSASVHKTVRKSHDSTAWWFTITAEEEYISRIDLHWAKISQHPKWVLLKSLKDRPRRPAVGTSPPSQVDESDLVTKDHQKSSEVSPTGQTEAATPQLSLPMQAQLQFFFRGWQPSPTRPPSPAELPPPPSDTSLRINAPLRINISEPDVSTSQSPRTTPATASVAGASPNPQPTSISPQLIRQ